MGLNNNPHSKKLTYVVTMLVIAVMLYSCSSTPSEKTLSVKDVQISGNCSDYMKVLDGDYNLKVIDDGTGLTMAIKLELTNEYPDSVKMIGSMGMGFKLNLLDKNGGTVGFRSVLAYFSGENSKIKDILNNGDVGKQITVTFKTNMYSEEEDVKRIIEEVVNFEIVGAEIINETTSPQVGSSDYSDDSFSSSLESGDADDALSAYEDFIDEYTSMVRNAANGDLSVLSDAANMLSKAQSMQQKLNKLKGSMTAEQAKKLSAISAKMLKSAADIAKYSTKDAEKAIKDAQKDAQKQIEDAQKQAEEMMRNMGM